MLFIEDFSHARGIFGILVYLFVLKQIIYSYYCEEDGEDDRKLFVAKRNRSGKLLYSLQSP